MPFDKDQDCSPMIQMIVGLMEPNCRVPRSGDRTRAGAHGVNLVSCSAHAQPLTQEDALRLWDLIPVAHKNAPATPLIAQSLSLLANMAGQGTPYGCARHLPNGQAQVENVMYYHTLGSPLFKVQAHALYFISFLYKNTDDGFRVHWQHMTGTEQYEWFNAFRACGDTYLHVEPNTRGLRGTDPGRVHGVPQLIEAVQRSPSFARRRTPNHRIPQGQWDTVRRHFEQTAVGTHGSHQLHL